MQLPNFIDLYDSDKEVQSLCLVAQGDDPYLRNSALVALRKVYRDFLKPDVTLRDLRIQAQAFGIPHYSKMDKSTLSMSIQYAKRSAANGHLKSDLRDQAHVGEGGSR
jgi:hypothetical protein